MKDETYELGHSNIGRLLIRYSVPAAIGMLVNSVYNIVDRIFVGWGAGPKALAALTVSFPIHMIVIAVAQVISIGAASLISRSLGSGDREKANDAAATSFIVSFALGLTITIFGLLFLTPLLKCFGARDSVLGFGQDYLSIILLGSPFFAFTVSSNGVIRAEGKAMFSMMIMLAGAIFNLILDPILIFGFDMGVKGAAIATASANILTFTIIIIYFMSGRSILKVTLNKLRPNIVLLKEEILVGSPAFVRMSASSLLAIIINNLIAHYGQDIHLAIFGISTNLMLFILMPIFGLAQGLQPIISFNYGACDLKRVTHALRTASISATVFTTLGFLFITAGAEYLMKMFGSDAEMHKEGIRILRIMAMSLPFLGYQVIGATLFQSLGKAGPALLLSVMRQIIFLIPLVILLPVFFGISGIWIAHPISDVLAFIIAVFFVHFEKRKLKTI